MAGSESATLGMEARGMKPRLHILFLLAALMATTGGCSSTIRRAPDPRYVQPTIAVLSFENRAAGPANWKIGDGIADMLVHALMNTGRYTVIERRELGNVVQEIRLQRDPNFRPEGRAETGRLKNVQYLIKGTITDFGHVSDHRLGFWHRLLRFTEGGSTAVLGMTLYVIDVESGQILASEAIDERVRAGNVAAEGTYKDVAFGGSVFYRTPLGKATRRAISRAVSRIAATIAQERWHPQVAAVDAHTLVITGGTDRRLRVGDKFQVLSRGPLVTDPDTGDVLGAREARVVGEVIVEEVNARFSVARVIDGSEFKVGQSLRPIRT